MLTYMEIDNYRTFKNLCIPQISRVNLFSGKNNAGKSAFLEAIYLHTNSFSEQSIFKILNEREELIERGNNDLYMSPLRHFFVNHKIEIENYDPVKISSNIDSTSINLGYSYVERDAGRVIRKTVDIHSDSDNREILLEDAFSLSLITHSEINDRSAEFPLYQDNENAIENQRVFRRSSGTGEKKMF